MALPNLYVELAKHGLDEPQLLAAVGFKDVPDLLGSLFPDGYEDLDGSLAAQASEILRGAKGRADWARRLEGPVSRYNLDLQFWLKAQGILAQGILAFGPQCATHNY